jgi:hypothetical protein
MNEEIRIRKMKELSVTGRDTLESLKQAKIKLDSVKSWITIDGFGGSLLISIVKNTKIKETSTASIPSAPPTTPTIFCDFFIVLLDV